MLLEMFSDSKIIKIIHSAKQDLEAIYSYKILSIIFLILRLPNFIREIKYCLFNFSKNICNIVIKEGSWRTNWQEPLSDDKKEYAANDVKYLAGK